MRRRRQRPLIRFGQRPTKLEYNLTEILSRYCGERNHTEGAEDTLCRIIQERDRAMTILALDRLKDPRSGC